MSRSDVLTIGVSAVTVGMGFIVGGPIWGCGFLTVGIIFLAVYFLRDDEQSAITIGNIEDVRSKVSPAPCVIVTKIEHYEGAGIRPPETRILLKNVGEHIVQNVGLSAFVLSGKEVTSTRVATLPINADETVVPNIAGDTWQRNLLSLLESEWFEDITKPELTTRVALSYENLHGNTFEMPFDLVYNAAAHRSLTKENRNRKILMEARNFGPVKHLL
jgi:hypothetical protein